MIDSEIILQKFNQFEICLSYNQIQSIKNGNITKVLDEHSKHSKEDLKRNKFAIVAGLIFLTLSFYLIFSSNLDLIPTISAGLGAGSLSWGVSQFKQVKSYQKNIHSLKQYFNNKDII